MPQRLKTDWILFGAVLAMAAFGLLILYSASSVTVRAEPNQSDVTKPANPPARTGGNGETDQSIRPRSSWYFVIRQSGWAVVAMGVMLALKRTHYRKFQNPAVAFSAIGVALMLLVVVYFLGTAHRWLRLGGSVGVQPSELAKPALVIFLAFFVTWRARAISHLRYTLVPAMVAVGGVLFWVVLPDLGTAAVLGAAAMVVFIVAGLEWRYCWIVAGLALLGLGVSVYAEPYRLGRVVQFFDPGFKVTPAWIKARAQTTLRTREPNYQSEESKIAVGSGGLVGLGLMNGRQKLFVPEAHTDFIYAVVGEELGLLGTAGLLAGFAVIFWRGLRAALRTRDDFGRYLALGATVVVVVQGLINMSVVLGIGPTKGIPLPMISYGGSSLLSTLALMGILMNVSEHAG